MIKVYRKQYYQNIGYSGSKVERRFFFKKLPVLALAFLVSFFIGCSNSSPKNAVDNTPLVNTAVVTAKSSMSGILVPDNTGVQQVYTQAKKRRIDNQYKYESWLAKKFMGNQDVNHIFRMDKDLRWNVKPKKKTYEECPLAGCANVDFKKMMNAEEEEPAYNPEGSDACPLKQVERSLDVKPTGATRVISGFNTQQYQAILQIIMQDEQMKNDTNRLTMDFWVTTPTESMKEVWKIHELALTNYQSGLATNNNPLVKFFSGNVLTALAGILGDVEKENTWKNEITRKFSIIQGYPISIKTEWFVSQNACKQAAKKEGSTLDNMITSGDPVGALSNAVGGFFKKKAASKAKAAFGIKPDEPLIRYIYDITSAEVKSLKDSTFDIPAGYKLKDRR